MTGDSYKQIYFKTAHDWETWLSENYDREHGIWLEFYKKSTGKPTIDYNSSVEIALCYGWIDSTVKSIDEQRFVRKFTVRKLKSNWSETNKKRVVGLIKSGRMKEPGMVKVDYARVNGLWDIKRESVEISILPEFSQALQKNKDARMFFEGLANSYRNEFIIWIGTAKREETRKKRIAESIELLSTGKKLGMK